jgi:hypothetical protein
VFSIKNKNNIIMNLTKRLLISMLTLLCCTGAWASSIPGALSGRFTINASGEKVVFSQGNLQYVGTWQFAENQWDCFSTSQYNDHRDLFGWGTGDAPNKVSDNNGDYGTFTDWGTNAITNGGNTENSGWRTLTKDEWVYLFYSRKNAATLFGFGSVNSKNGLIILPDNWTTPEGASFTASTTLGLTNQGSYYHNVKEDNYTHNTYTAEQWAVMESAGAVFLPAAAYRHWVDSNIYYTDGGGFYWSSTPFSTDNAYYLNFYYNDLDPQFNEMRCGGRPVRLVRSSLDQDAEGYYLLGSADDWKDFAAIVNSGTNPAANAKMTADIDLGDDQTHIGDNNNLSYAYCGVFDGQGHKLNVNYYSSSPETTVEGGYSIAPFRNIKGATIKNLAVTGNITGYMHCAGVVGYAVSPSTNLISNVTVSANITILNTHGGGFIGHNEYATTTIQDCLFNGTINGKSGGSTVGVFFGWSGSATMSLINCLENGSYTNCSTFTPTSCPGYAVPTVTNCYYAVSGSYPGTHATSAELSDGTTATALQAGRAEIVWVQDPGTKQPMLAIFANGVTLTDGDNLSALETFAGKTCTVAYSRSFTAGISSTVCLPFAFAKGSVGTFYTFTGISKSGSEYIADMTEYTGDNLEANTPYLFLPSATGNVDFGGTYAIPASLTAGSTVSGDWTFLGTYVTVSWTEAPTGIYGFSAQNVDAQGISQGEFVKVGAYVRIRPMRCYLKYDDGNSDYAGARSMTRGAEAEQLPETIKVRLIGANGEVTGIGSLQTKTGEIIFDSDAWYTLDGVQLDGKPTRKGIYVNNGKKVIIK